MSIVQIEFNPTLEKPFSRTGSRTFDRVYLEPGFNVVDADEWNKVSGGSLVKALVESGVIKVSSPSSTPAPETPAAPISQGGSSASLGARLNTIASQSAFATDKMIVLKTDGTIAFVDIPSGGTTQSTNTGYDFSKSQNAFLLGV